MGEKLTRGLAEESVQKVRFGNFEIVNDPEGRPLSLGKGTFGRTYQARHCYLDTIVALKIITERYAADAAVRQRFLIEARAVAKLSHPHIARLYDFGEMDGVLHYAMEYCGGGSLADHVAKHGAMGLRQVMEVGQQITGALKCAHGAGFIHRDLKPSNIMLTAPEGPLYTKLIDFGLVQPSVPGATRSVSDDHSVDGARFLGTPLFASPEQLREEPMDVRTDLFSLGITLWYLLQGGAPESGSSAAIAASRLSAESYAGRLPATLPPPFRDVLVRLLEKDRKKRFGSAAEVFAAFNLCAATLGFRRARDYTDPKSELSEWEDDDSGGQEVSQTAEPEPIEVQAVAAELDTDYRIVTRINEDFTGLNYVAEPLAEPERPAILHVLHPMLLEDSASFERFRIHIAQLMALDLPEVLRPQAIKAYSDYVTVVFEKPEENDLMGLLRTGRTVHLIEAAPLLETIADACDRLCEAGLPGAQLAPGRIYLEWPDEGSENASGGRQLGNARPRLYPRLLAVSEAPELARLNEPEDVSSTMTTDMLSDPGRADNMPEHFGTLLYRVVAGRNCPIAASLSSQAYVAIPGLSEHSNRLLSLVIAKQIASTSCGQILREVLGAEGIVSRVPGHPTAGYTARPGSTVSPPGVTPTPAGKTPTRIATTFTPGADKHATPARSWKAPTVTPSPVVTPAVAKRSPPPVSSAPPPIPQPVPAAPPIIGIAKPPAGAVADEPIKISPPTPVQARAKDSLAPTPEKRDLEKPISKRELAIPSPAAIQPAPAAEKISSPPPAPMPAVAKQSPAIAPEGKTDSADVPAEISGTPPIPAQKTPSAPLFETRAKDIVPPIEATASAKERSATPGEEPAKTITDKSAVAKPSAALVPEGKADSLQTPAKVSASPPPVEIRAKDLALPTEAKSTPKKPSAKSAEEPTKTVVAKVPAMTKGRDDLQSKSDLPTLSGKTAESPKSAEKISITPTQKREVPPPVIFKPPISKPAEPRTKAAPKPEPAVLPPEQLGSSSVWKNVKLRPVGIGIAALLLVTLSYATVRKFTRGGAIQPTKVVTVPPASHPSPAAPKPIVSAAVNPARAKPAEPSRPVIAGRYVGQVRSLESSGTGPKQADREISIDAGLSSGYVIDYAIDSNKRIPLTEGRWDDQGNYVARALFSSATGGVYGDESFIAHPGKNQGLDVTFKGGQGGGAEYAWTGFMHPWGAEDQTRQDKLLADQAAATQKQKSADEARQMAQRMAAAKAKADADAAGQRAQKDEQRTAATKEPAHRRQQAAGQGEKSGGSAAHQAAAAPPPPPAAKPASHPPPTKTKTNTETQQRRRPEFEGSAPGG